MSQFNNNFMTVDQSKDTEGGLFAIRGSLDGEVEKEFTEKEQFIGLKISEEVFFLPISVVNEIIMLPIITYVPQSPNFIEGVINLRGTILPAINVRKMMGLHRGEVTSSTRTIIVRHENMPFGLIVDGITYVVSLLPSEIENQSLPGKNLGTDLITRISKFEDKVIGILDLSKIVATAAEGKLPEESENSDS